jgi:hypothetical protein
MTESPRRHGVTLRRTAQSTNEVLLHPVLRMLGRLMAVGTFLQGHVTETGGFAADITRKHRERRPS